MMRIKSRFVFYAVVSLVVVFCAEGINAVAQISITSPTEGEVTHMPVWLRADAATCNGQAVTSFGYSYDSSPFMTWGFSDASGWHVDTIEFRLAPTPTQSAYKVHYKAWSSAGECTQDVDVSLTGNTATPVFDVQTLSNDPTGDSGYPGNLEVCPHTSQIAAGVDNDWYWDWDAGTSECTYPKIGLNSPDYSNSYNGVTSPSQDQKSRAFYTVWQASGAGTPGERYSIDYAQGASTASYFVYTTYIYIPSPYPANIQTAELDTNWVDSSGNVVVLGLQCVHGTGWQYTTYTYNGTYHSIWNTPNPPLACDPQSWTSEQGKSTSTPDGWHHVELAGHRDNSGNVSYDYIVVDAHYSHLTSWTGPSRFPGGWTPGDIVLNFQIDGINNSGNEATAAIYTDGMEMLRGAALW